MSDNNFDFAAMARAHEMEQAIAAVNHFAKMLRAFHLSLMREGFTPDEALQLVKQYQGLVLRNNQKGGNT